MLPTFIFFKPSEPAESISLSNCPMFPTKVSKLMMLKLPVEETKMSQTWRCPAQKGSPSVTNTRTTEQARGDDVADVVDFHAFQLSVMNVSNINTEDNL